MTELHNAFNIIYLQNHTQLREDMIYLYTDYWKDESDQLTILSGDVLSGGGEGFTGDYIQGLSKNSCFYVKAAEGSIAYESSL